MNRIFFITGIYLISLILIFSGLSKIIDTESLNNSLGILHIFPEPLIIGIAVLLPLTEIMLGILLLIEFKPKVILTVTGLLFFCFLLFSLYGTLAGITTDCGCFGDLIKSDIGWGMVIRNSVFFFIIILLYFYSADRNVQTR